MRNSDSDLNGASDNLGDALLGGTDMGNMKKWLRDAQQKVRDIREGATPITKGYRDLLLDFVHRAEDALDGPTKQVNVELKHVLDELKALLGDLGVLESAPAAKPHDFELELPVDEKENLPPSSSATPKKPHRKDAVPPSWEETEPAFPPKRSPFELGDEDDDEEDFSRLLEGDIKGSGHNHDHDHDKGEKHDEEHDHDGDEDHDEDHEDDHDHDHDHGGKVGKGGKGGGGHGGGHGGHGGGHGGHNPGAAGAPQEPWYKRWKNTLFPAGGALALMSVWFIARGNKGDIPVHGKKAVDVVEVKKDDKVAVVPKEDVKKDEPKDGKVEVVEAKEDKSRPKVIPAETPRSTVHKLPLAREATAMLSEDGKTIMFTFGAGIKKADLLRDHTLPKKGGFGFFPFDADGALKKKDVSHREGRRATVGFAVYPPNAIMYRAAPVVPERFIEGKDGTLQYAYPIPSDLLPVPDEDVTKPFPARLAQRGYNGVYVIMGTRDAEGKAVWSEPRYIPFRHGVIPPPSKWVPKDF